MVRGDASGLETRFEYDALGRLAGQVSRHPGGWELARWRWEIPLDGVPRLAGLRLQGGQETASAFAVDATGRIASETHYLDGAGTFALAPDASSAQANALADSVAAQSSRFRFYSLDGRHNWLATTDQAGTIERAVDAADAYVKVGGTAPTYTASGQLATDGTARYAYSSFGELIRAEKSSGGSAIVREYVRDALGRIVLERDPKTGEITRYAYDGARRTLRKRPGGGIDLTLAGDDPDAHLVWLDPQDDRYFLHQDRTGSVTLVTDLQARVIERYDYTAFGEMVLFDRNDQRLEESAVGNRFGFQGHPHDPRLGLVEMRARTYRPAWGRFLEPDPLGLAAGSNPYAFADGAPLSWRDPWGLAKERPDGIDAGAWRTGAFEFDGECPFASVSTEIQHLAGVGFGTDGEHYYVAVDGLSFEEWDRSLYMSELHTRQTFAHYTPAERRRLEQAVRSVNTARWLTERVVMEGITAWGAGKVLSWGGKAIRWGRNAWKARGAGSGARSAESAATIRRYPDGSYRTPDGKFASRAGQRPPGSGAADEFANHLSRNGMDVVGREVGVRGPLGKRTYDVVVRRNGKLWGVEVKSGGARPTRYQEFTDMWVDRNGAYGIGKIAGERVHGTVTVYVP